MADPAPHSEPQPSQSPPQQETLAQPEPQLQAQPQTQTQAEPQPQEQHDQQQQPQPTTSSSVSIHVAAPPQQDSKSEEDIDWDFWAQVLNDFDTVEKNQTKLLKKHIKKGIPKTVRGRAWQLLCRGRNPELEEKYAVLLKKQSPHEKTIIRDLARTFPDNDFFKSEKGDGQTSLFNVVKAYSMHDPSVGYCQGLAFIAGALLLNMPDEQAFCTLISLMESYGLHDLFIPSMEGLQLCLYQFDNLLELMLPRIHQHLEAEGVKSSMYASQWFMTLFLYRFPIDFVFRLWDILFLDGLDAIFRFSIALLMKNEAAILQMDFERLLDFLKNGLPEVYYGKVDELIQDASKVQIRQRYMMRLEKEFMKMRATTAKELSELEVLKRSQEELNAKNSKLAEKVAALSKENCKLTRDIESTKEASTKSGDTTEALQQQVKELQQIINANEPGGTTKAKPRKTKKTSPQKWEKEDRETEQEVADILRALVEENALLRSMLEDAQNHSCDLPAHAITPASRNSSGGSAGGDTTHTTTTHTTTAAPSTPTTSALAPPVTPGKTRKNSAAEPRASTGSVAALDAVDRSTREAELSEDQTMEQQLIAFKLKYAQAEEARLELSIRFEALQRYVESLQDENNEKKLSHALPQLQEKGKTLLARIRKPAFLPNK